MESALTWNITLMMGKSRFLTLDSILKLIFMFIFDLRRRICFGQRIRGNKNYLKYSKYIFQKLFHKFKGIRINNCYFGDLQKRMDSQQTTSLIDNHAAGYDRHRVHFERVHGRYLFPTHRRPCKTF